MKTTISKEALKKLKEMKKTPLILEESYDFDRLKQLIEKKTIS